MSTATSLVGMPYIATTYDNQAVPSKGFKVFWLRWVFLWPGYGFPLAVLVCFFSAPLLLERVCALPVSSCRRTRGLVSLRGSAVTYNALLQGTQHIETRRGGRQQPPNPQIYQDARPVANMNRNEPRKTRRKHTSTHTAAYQI